MTLEPRWNELLYARGNFQVYVRMFRFGEWKDVDGYSVINTRTGVVEAETNNEAVAIKIARDLDQDLNQVLESEDAEFEEVDPQDVDAVIARLGEGAGE